MMIRSHFAGGVSEQYDMQKAISDGWRKESRPRYQVSVYSTIGPLVSGMMLDLIVSVHVH